MAQSWLQLSIRTSAAKLDALSNFVVERGSPGVVLKRNGLDAFFPRSGNDKSLRREVERHIHGIGSKRAQRPRLRWKIIKPENWEQSWKKFIKPRRVGKNFWVTPPWLTPPKFRRRRVITIEPGMAFGTGTHATTRGCMEFIELAAERVGRKKFTALDVGTGSGILAIALAFLGAAQVWAIDNDPVAVNVARENLRVNGVAEKVQVSGGNLSTIKRKFAVVIANLTAETILELADTLENRVAPMGFMILSGILQPKAGAVVRRFGADFQIIERRRKQEWMTLLLQRKN